MIIGTAGHVDHGKTTLVRALTGVDTDRLPEEKRRGMSIELGYAYLDLSDPLADPGAGSPRRLAFIDVPGHERLLHTMLAGATGIEHALLLVAADDGVMPQTREHAAVLALLGIERGTIVITKCDRVDAARIDEVVGTVRELLAPTPLAAAPIVPVSAIDGTGIETLRAHLVAAERESAPRDASRGFRVAIDRVFTLAGVGTVVTGTAHDGEVRVGDELAVLPGGDRAPMRVRVRGLRAQNATVDAARAGDRCALALTGVAKDQLSRGQWLCAPSIACESARIDVLLQVWPGESAALRASTTVHVHLGTRDELATVVPLVGDRLLPGAAAAAQLVLRAPVGAWHGDRGVLRDASASRTVAGFRVLDPHAPARYRRKPERLARLAALALPGALERSEALLRAAPLGLELAALARSYAIADPRALPLPAEAIRIDAAGEVAAAIMPAALAALEDGIVQRLAQFHASEPDEIGLGSERLRRLVAAGASPPIWRYALDRLVKAGRLRRQGAWLQLPRHGAELSAAEERLAQRLLPLLLQGGFDPPWVRDLARVAAAPEAVVRVTLANLARRGTVYAVVKDLFYPAATVEQLAALARSAAADDGGVAAATFRDATGLGRKRAIQVLEFFDRAGYTRRVGDVHRLRSDIAF